MDKRIPLRRGKKDSMISFLCCPHCKKAIGIQYKGEPISPEYKKEQCIHCKGYIDWSVKSVW